MDDVKDRVSLDDRLDAAATTGMTLAAIGQCPCSFCATNCSLSRK